MKKLTNLVELPCKLTETWRRPPPPRRVLICLNNESNFTALAGVWEIFPRPIPSIHSLTSMRLEPFSQYTVVLHFSPDLKMRLFRRIEIMRSLLNTGNDKRQELINSLAPRYGSINIESRSHHAPPTTHHLRRRVRDLMSMYRLRHGKWFWLMSGNRRQVKWQPLAMMSLISKTRIVLRKAAALTMKRWSAKKWNMPWRIWSQPNCQPWSKSR